MLIPMMVSSVYFAVHTGRLRHQDKCIETIKTASGRVTFRESLDPKWNSIRWNRDVVWIQIDSQKLDKGEVANAIFGLPTLTTIYATGDPPDASRKKIQARFPDLDVSFESRLIAHLKEIFGDKLGSVETFEDPSAARVEKAAAVRLSLIHI